MVSEEPKPKRAPRRKHTDAESVAAPVALEHGGVPPVPMLTQDELFKLQLFQAQAERAIAEAEASRMRKKWILALLDPKGTVEAEEKRTEKHKAEAKDFFQKYETIKARVSMRLNLDLGKCGFDAETGVIQLPDSAKGTT